MRMMRLSRRDSLATAIVCTVTAAAFFTGCAQQHTGHRIGKARLMPSAARLAGRQPAAPVLVRSDRVIAGKIAREEAELRDADEHEARNPGDRFKEWYHDRAGEDGIFTFDEVLAAKAHVDRMSELPVPPGLRDGGIWDWEWLGPGNIGGRIRAIVVDSDNPSIMYVGGVGGGIWKSTNAGATWTPLDDFLANLAVCSLVIDPDDPDTLYAGTGEGFGNQDALPGAGVFKTTDAGSTWDRLPDTVGWQFTNRLAIDPENGQNLLAATGSGIYRTSNGGADWFFEQGGNFLDIRFDPNNGSNAIASGNAAALYSTDGGQTWDPASFNDNPASTAVRVAFSTDGDTDPDEFEVDSTSGFSPGDGITINGEMSRVSDVVDGDTLLVNDLSFAHAVGESVASQVGGRVELAYAPSSPNIVYAAMNVGRGTIWRSTDGGENFSIASNTADDYLGKQGWYDNCIWVAPDDSNLVVVGGIDLWRSTDGGASLTKISRWQDYHTGGSAHADNHAIVHHPDYGSGNNTVYHGNDGGIQRADDITTVAETSGWVNLANNLGITQFYGGAASPDGAYIIGGTQDNDTLRWRDVDGPQAWFQADYGDGGYCAIDYDDPDNPIFYDEYVNLAISKSTDKGLNYSSATSGLGDAGDDDNARFIAPFSIDPNDNDNLVAGGTSIWRTTDEAGSWSSIRGKLSGSPKCSAIDIAVGDSSRIWVGYEGGRVSYSSSLSVGQRPGRPQLRRQSSAGGNGTPLHHQHASAAQVGGGPAQLVPAWVDVDDNGPLLLPDRTVTDIAINPKNANEVFVTFAGYNTDSVWYTDDNGATWQERTGAFPNDLPALQVNTVRFHPVDSDWVYIGTDLGVFASEDRGLTWNKTPRYEDNEGPVNTEVAELVWQGEYLIAATHGRGMFRVRPLVVVYVDKANGGFEDGTLAFPYDTVHEGIDAAGHGTTISIEAGDYNEVNPVSFFKRGKVIATHGTVSIR